MSQFVGSMDEEKVKTKPLLLSATNKKPPPPPSFLSLFEAQVISLLAALLFACIYPGFAAYNLRNPCQEPAWFLGCYELTGLGVVAASHALLRGLMWCSAPQGAAAALALAQLAGGRNRRSLGVRAAACVALAATAASHWMYLRMLGLLRTDSPGDLLLPVETGSILAFAALDLFGFMVFVLGVDDEQAGRARARAVRVSNHGPGAPWMMIRDHMDMISLLLYYVLISALLRIIFQE